jgi:hypothetical protein
LIGGFMIKNVGTRPTYQIFAISSVVFSIIYFLFHKFVTLKRPQRKINDIMKPQDREIQMENGSAVKTTSEEKPVEKQAENTNEEDTKTEDDVKKDDSQKK